ncbi:hypothetical protein GCM10009409_11460 [Shewanella saliphila]|uniref:Uncharacterized protein n=1 Tax=Shewanella saliphila TaxID=2282698 RepID=A0ABQ2Q3A7_9GAMM|nr:hypothetical protein GCM10009409_11460 [Shewanella saliphila]
MDGPLKGKWVAHYGKALGVLSSDSMQRQHNNVFSTWSVLCFEAKGEEYGSSTANDD